PNFVRWLALTIARMPDYRVSSLLAKQLDDELGNGKPERIHRTLLERFVAGLDPFGPRAPEHRVLQAGERLATRSSEVFDTGTPYEAIGGLMVAEIFAKNMDTCLGNEIRRQERVPREALEWLDIHEVLEVNHAADSYELAVLVPDHGPELTAAWQGAQKLWAAMWGFLDDVLAAVTAVRPA
ncbi:MAG TPA: iron-containing redox enzyme family protein, partial [Polyangiaceae bacterium]|nr:iron-containing redox enzyme family protein [Polyangiaceae bacterium]